MPDIPNPPEFSLGGIVSWALMILCGAILALWRLNETKNAAAITALSSQQVDKETKYEKKQTEIEAKYEARLTKAEEANHECQEDRIKIREQFAVLSERLTNMEKQMVHKAD